MIDHSPFNIVYLSVSIYFTFLPAASYKLSIKRSKAFASLAGGLRNWNAAVFASFKK